MLIGERLRTLREENELSQGDIKKRIGLLSCDISSAWRTALQNAGGDSPRASVSEPSLGNGVCFAGQGVAL